METRQSCPRCQSADITGTSDREKRQYGGFQLMPLRRCRRCGHLWEPAASARVLVGGLAAGATAVGLGVLLVLYRIYVGVMLVLVGGGVIAICLKRLRQKSP